MSEPYIMRDFSMRYCPALHDHVMIVHEGSLGSPVTHQCLSSHLCETESRMHCSYTSKPSVRGDAEILGKVRSY